MEGLFAAKFPENNFFPTLHTKEELDTWGKQWVDHVFNPEKEEYKE